MNIYFIEQQWKTIIGNLYKAPHSFKANIKKDKKKNKKTIIGNKTAYVATQFFKDPVFCQPWL